MNAYQEMLAEREEEDRSNTLKIATFKKGDRVCLPELDGADQMLKFVRITYLGRTPMAVLEWPKGHQREYPLRYVEAAPPPVADWTFEFTMLLLAAFVTLACAAAYWR